MEDDPRSEEPQNINYTPAFSNLCQGMINLATGRRHEFVTPEHMLAVLLHTDEIRATASDSRIEECLKRIDAYLDSLETVPDNISYEPEFSTQMRELLFTCYQQAECSGCHTVKVSHCVNHIFDLRESLAASVLRFLADSDRHSFMIALIDAFGDNGDADATTHHNTNYEYAPEEERNDDWRQLVVCVNDCVDSRNPLIGRGPELERTIRVLCRKDKNNPLHVGEPGVGKTALVYGLARLINEGRVPTRLRHSRIYSLDLGTLLSGTKYRGDLEKRIKTLMDGIGSQESPIVYIDEIHNLVGAGAVDGGSMDASNMLKPYLERGDIRFIGSTTYEEYNRFFSRSKGIVRRFQQIDILEPDICEAIGILRQLRPGYESFHNVRYTDGAIEYAVKATARHISDRRLPDKAIDLLDEAGAYRAIHPLDSPAADSNVVDSGLMEHLLARMCRIEPESVKADPTEALASLGERISAQVYGQHEAVERVTDAVLMSKAGLTEEEKPLASLLFVGPTGVGKTEVAKVLAGELGVELVRLDMSEYAEKHAVAKLIGAPAGYVGYDDGGILTDAVRRTPSCVLLLDEIEKAHPDIFNILLQVMDYGRLTDNKGRHTDFRNVILIMTSNAGAQYAAQAKVGFGNNTTSGQAMMKEVKRMFKPEFINRLSATVVFSEMDRTMAALILDKKLRQLQAQTERRGVTVRLTEEARELILREGFTREYGARELDRVIASRLKPILMREMLFGRLKDGGEAVVVSDGDSLRIE